MTLLFEPKKSQPAGEPRKKGQSHASYGFIL